VHEITRQLFRHPLESPAPKSGTDQRHKKSNCALVYILELQRYSTMEETSSLTVQVWNRWVFQKSLNL